jgi:NAD(P)-dependent dehydrogenase (short-subunit alcohol dehydrogenase family)
MEQVLKDRVVLITGAARGQGRAAALRFSAEGARLVVTDVDAEGLAETNRLVEEQGGETASQAAELTDAGDLKRLLDMVEDSYGALDCLYNNAGVVSGGTIAEYTEEEWDRVFAVNAKSSFFLTQAVLPLLQRSDHATVINTSSLVGVVGIQGGTVYGASKGALVGLTRNLAYELADDGIRVYCLIPGVIDTPMPRKFLEAFPAAEQDEVEASWVARQLFKRFGLPEEVVSVAAFLASDDASFMTGTVIPVDGGWLTW